MRISTHGDCILFTCDHCQVGALIQDQKSKRAFMRHLNKFERVHNLCEGRKILSDRRDRANKVADEILGKLMGEQSV